ncbi:MAG TPA: thiol reductant ABC exporter subunit CydC [Chloroflexia bacterium]|nr:thiol reductant ABC exporter subunit CydC [Chloroflexia bacterium]
MPAVLKRLIKLALPLKWWMALAALLGFLTIGSSIGLMATSAYLISMAALHPSVAVLSVAIVGVRFFGIGRGIFRYLERYVSHYVTFGLLSRLRVWFYRAIEPLAPARLMHYRGGDLLSRVVSDIDTLQNFYVRVLAPVLVSAITGLFMWFFLGAYDLTFALTLIFFYLMAGAGVPLLTHLLSREVGSQIISTRSELNAQIVDSIQGMPDLLAYGQEESQLEKVSATNRRLVALQNRMAWVSGLQAGLGNLLVNLAIWTMLIVAIPAVHAGRLDGVYLALLVLAALSSFEAVLPLPAAAQQLGSSAEAARRLFEIVDSQPEIVENGKISPQPENYGLEFEKVSFRYNQDEPLALGEVSFNIRQGSCLAIVGPSGSGKSTIINLLLRFWDYNQGSIRLGGHDLKDFRQEDLLKLVSVVEQQTHLFNATIRENLLLANPATSEEAMIKAVKQAQLYDFIMAQPQGFDTPVGEQGLRLSGGERQRLAIARAFLRDTPLLILDEATANLDTLTEREVLASLQALRQGRTTIIVTHRLVGLEMADEIVVMQNGRVEERGIHRQLVQHEGLYWKMWQLQNQFLAEQAA